MSTPCMYSGCSKRKYLKGEIYDPAKEYYCCLHSPERKAKLKENLHRFLSDPVKKKHYQLCQLQYVRRKGAVLT